MSLLLTVPGHGGDDGARQGRPLSPRYPNDIDLGSTDSIQFFVPAKLQQAQLCKDSANSYIQIERLPGRTDSDRGYTRKDAAASGRGATLLC